MSRSLFGVALIVFAAKLLAQPAKEEPVGLVLNAGNGKLVRAGTETPIAARTADVLFSGDSLRAADPMTFLYCPGKTSQILQSGGEALLDGKQLKVKAGQISAQKPAACFLPQLVRVAVASQQHYGITMTRGLGDAPAPVPADKLPADVVGDLAPFEQALKADPGDVVAVLGRAAVFEKHSLPANALAEYQKAGVKWTDATWIKQRIFELQDQIATAASKAAAELPAGGQTYSLIVGVSKYQKLPKDLWLQYADADATTFAKHEMSPRGGSVPADNVLLLTNEQATTAALRSAFNTFLKARAGKKDTVFILIAGHGTVETTGSRGAYVLTYDSDPQDLASTALPMAEVQNLIQEQLSKVGRVVLFADVCHSGAIGSIKSTAINAAVERLGEVDGDIFGLTASRPKELSFEGPEFGGGHGAFTYYLLKGLLGDADKNKDGIVDVNEAIEYVREKVASGTQDKQHPRDFGTLDNKVPLAWTDKAGIQLSSYPVLMDSANRPLLLASAAPFFRGQNPSSAKSAVDRFESALRDGKLLPDEPASAFAALRELQPLLDPSDYLRRQNELRVALEDRAQQILLRYLAGEQSPPARNDFVAGAEYMEADQRLTPESLYLQDRADFFRGRTLIFDKNYAQAADLLDRAIAIDPSAAYAYNALGIAWLEQADYRAAAGAFRDAARKAPYWAYPLHNLALTYVEMGEDGQAIRAYQQAMRLAPNAAYLPYNLGLVYQKIGRRTDADVSYRKAMALAPESAEPYNALGSLKAAAGKRNDAEKLYREALRRNPGLLAARHNLAELLWSENDRGPEAISLWRENLSTSPDYLPTRLSLAQALSESGDVNGAIQQYSAVLNLRPQYAAAHAALGALYQKSGQAAGALTEYRAAIKIQPDNPALLERVGDVERSSGDTSAANEAYRSALQLTTDRAARKRLRQKLK